MQIEIYFHGINSAFTRLLHLNHHGAPPYPLEGQATTGRSSLCQLRAVSFFLCLIIHLLLLLVFFIVVDLVMIDGLCRFFSALI
jgi:hypothetical protein